MNPVTPLLAAVDGWQRRHRVAAVLLAVNHKFGDDQANQQVVALGWYGFVAVYPLLLLAVTVLGFVGARSLGQGLLHTLHQFPVVGGAFEPESRRVLPASVPGLVVGLVLLLYGAQGVTQTAQQAMAQVWNVPVVDRPGFGPRLGRSLAGLAVIGATFLGNAVAASYATAGRSGPVVGAAVVVGMVAVNGGAFTASFRVLTPVAATRQLVPGALVAGTGFTLLITVGAGLAQHQIRHSSSTYGQFGVVIGLVGFLFLLAKLTLYGAELNPVLARRLWPRALVADRPTSADRRFWHDQVHQARRRPEQVVGAGYGPDGPRQAADEAWAATGSDAGT